jgi:prepilin-type N-terminal cleavage/methylation domain-containing protein
VKAVAETKHQNERAPHVRPSRRRGFTIFEMMAATAVLGVVVTTSALLVQWSASLHRVATKKRCALEAATTMLDRINARPWPSITAQSVQDLQLPAEAKRFLGDPRLAVAVTDQAGPPRGKKISVAVSWTERAGQRPQEVKLTSWVFEPGGEK